MVVGSHGLDGKALWWSQTGPQVNMYALGDNSRCADKSNPMQFMVDRGTSLGKPDRC